MNTLRSRIVQGLSLALLLAAAPARAGVTDLSDLPLIIASPSSVQPNLMFVLDDSGSMAFDFLPDHVNGDGSPDRKLCRTTGATSSTATGTFNSGCCTNTDESNACWAGAAPFSSRGHPPFLAAGFNGLAYNPTIRYLPPVNYMGVSAGSVTDFTAVKNDYYNIQNTGSINLTTQYPDLEWCTSNAYTDCLRNGNYVLPGTVNAKNYTTAHATTATGSGYLAMGAPESPGAVAQDFGPHYYKIIPNEYCDSPNLRNCQVGATGGFTYPALVRYCDTSANATASTPNANSCQAIRTTNYTYARYPTTYPSVTTGGTGYIAATPGTPGTAAVAATMTATITAPSGTDCNVTKVTVGTYNSTSNYDLLQNVATGVVNGRPSIATAIATGINNKTAITGFSASVNNRTVTITAPVAAGNFTNTVTVTNSCSLVWDVALKFSGYQAAVAGIPGTPAVPATAGVSAARFERVDIIPARTSYPKAASRTDCAGSDCTYTEEMTNFANWWTYYHSRMQMMKSSVTLAFNGVPATYRVGYMTINDNNSGDFLNMKTFANNSTARQTWWSKLTAAKPANSTPLRTALSTVGRYYGGKYNSGTTSINHTTTVDPVQYSCQRNYLLLSTDGFWNETTTPKQLDGTTVIGDQDSTLARPYKDGNAVASTLADTAYYYYNTDLRTGTTGSTACNSFDPALTNSDVCGNNASDPKQRMVTFTLGLGASGYMQYRSTYATDTDGDYYAVANGVTPSTTVCVWQTSGACTWPSPVSNTLTTIDDLWHAAVNGGGRYFSAVDPTSLYSGLSDALSAIDDDVGASAAATTSTPNVTAADNQAFVSTFKSGEWTGELQSRRITVSGTGVGTISATPDWSAQTKLNGNTSRNIFMYSSTGTDNKRSFDWASLTAAEQAYFSKTTMVASGLVQFCSTGTSCLPDASQTAAAGKPVVDFLRGDRTNEGTLGDTTKYFRRRTYLLGDIVDSEATYVKLTQAYFSDAGYSDYANSTIVQNRPGMVYVGANDGMMHAFRADTGDELWAFVPSAVLPKMHKLVDKSYASKHTYFVDGTPVVRDFYDGTKWRTLLVAGLGGGGRAYFGIDVTDPTNPIPLWEFSPTNLGYTYGKAEVAKLKNGKWVVMVPSGYNNVSPGDGQGRLYVLDALTGAAATGFSSDGIVTPAGSTATPSGFAQIRAWADNGAYDATALRVYGGDVLGNVWRFNINADIGATLTAHAQLLATLRNSSSQIQPITSRPELGQVDTNVMVYLGTGRYLGLGDIGDSTTQSIYAIKDKLDDSTYPGTPRDTVNAFVKQTVVVTAGSCQTTPTACVAGTSTRTTGTALTIDYSVNNGWYVDLPVTYERANTDPQLVQGLLVVNTNVINNESVCTVGGSSWQNYFDYRTGAMTSVYLDNRIATRVSIIKIGDQLYAETQLSDGQLHTDRFNPPLAGPQARRTSWRELPDQPAQ